MGVERKYNMYCKQQQSSPTLLIPLTHHFRSQRFSPYSYRYNSVAFSLSMLWSDSFRVGMLEGTRWCDIESVVDVTESCDINIPSRHVWHVRVRLMGGKNASLTTSTVIPLLGCPNLLPSAESTPDSIYFLNCESIRVLGIPLIQDGIDICSRMKSDSKYAKMRDLPLLLIPATKVTAELRRGLRNTNIPEDYIRRVRVHACRMDLLSDVRMKVIQGELTSSFERLVELRLGHNTSHRRVTDHHYLNDQVRNGIVLGALRSSNPLVRNKLYTAKKTLQENIGFDLTPSIREKNLGAFRFEDNTCNALGAKNLDLVMETIAKKYDSMRGVGNISFRSFRFKLAKRYLARYKLGGGSNVSRSIRQFEFAMKVALFNLPRAMMYGYMERHVLSLVNTSMMRKRR